MGPHSEKLCRPEDCHFFPPEYRPGPLPGLDENAEPFVELDEEDEEAADLAAAAIFSVEERLPDPEPLNQPI